MKIKFRRLTTILLSCSLLCSLLLGGICPALAGSAVERVYAEIEAISKEEGPENPSFFLETKEIKHYSSSRRI
ncbi:MAG: hypothetical protein LBI70_01165, partial [Rickettsiales bacterium]|nr:hypothetical protein [Rickettsiales bacterium]